MKITKKQLRRIIKEEKARLLGEIRISQIDQDMASIAKTMGAMLVGRPDVAKSVSDALGDVYPESAKALYDAWSRAQADADDIYMASDWD